VRAYSTDPDVTSGLEDKLAAAESAPNRMTRDSLLRAFELQVVAQTGRALTAQQAHILIALAKALE